MAKHQSMPDDFGARLALAFRTLCDQTRTLDLLGRYESRFTRKYIGPSTCSKVCERSRANPNSCFTYGT